MWAGQIRDGWSISNGRRGKDGLIMLITFPSWFGKLQWLIGC